METRKKLLVIFCLLQVNLCISQVNLQKGSLEHSIPIYSYTDNPTNLKLDLQLNYSSGHGLQVNSIPTCIGQGWQIKGVGSITRLQKGQPDDQYPQEAEWYDINNPLSKYPPGYLYNSRSINDGCPNLLMSYPLFTGGYTGYFDFNEKEADRELDEFVYNFNGHTGSFVLDKQNLGNVVLINNSKIKITANLQVHGIPACRTTITKFTILDEGGLQYEFAAITKTRSQYKHYSPYEFQWGEGSFRILEEVPLSADPYIANNWSLTKITDVKTGRFIKIDYAENSVFREGRYDAQVTFDRDYEPVNHNYVLVAGTNMELKTHVTKLIVSELKPEISKITLPDNNYLNFNYGDQRFDLSGSFKLSDITHFNSLNERVSKIKFNQKYFIKNNIEEANQQNKRWSRLCLTSIDQYGKTDADKTSPLNFEYYLGDNSTENFVPPIFFHAQDPWGYYNGDFSGLSTTDFLSPENTTYWNPDFPSFKKLASYNFELNTWYPGDTEFGRFDANSKTNYAKNGLLKKITNSYGGSLQFEYKQNTISDLHNKRFIYSKSELINPNNQPEPVVGGVHIAKIIESNGTTETTTDYNYWDESGNSTLWGIEQPKNAGSFDEFYKPESRYFDGACICCKYRYQYLGNQYASMTTFDFFEHTAVGEMYQIQGLYKTLAGGLSQAKRGKTEWQQAIFQIILNLTVSCFGETMSETRNLRYKKNQAFNLTNSLPIGFTGVTVKKYSNLIPNNGKSVYNFSSEDDYPLLIPTNNFPYTNKPRCYTWNYGLLKSEKVYDANNTIVKEVINNYDASNNILNTSENTKSCNCASNYTESMRWENWADPSFVNSYTNVNVPGKLEIEFYNILSGRNELRSTTEKLYKGIGNYVESTKEYTYNAINYLPSIIKNTNSKGNTIETKTYYVEDYNLSNPSNAILNQMKNENIVNTPVSTETWLTKAGNSPEMLSASVIEFGTIPNGGFKPKKIYSLQTDKPVPLSIIGAFNPNQLIRDNTLIIPQKEIIYNTIGNAVQDKDIPGLKNSSILYSYGSQYPIANISNAAVNEVAYTSFEGFSQGNTYNSSWDISNVDILTETSPTGDKSCLLKVSPYESLITATISINQEYKLSLWATSTAFTINNTFSPTLVGPTINGWTYYEFNIPNGAVAPVIKGNNCKIDELRLYPQKASMSTTTYTNGMRTSECDANNRIVYYEYDGLGRLVKVLDERRNIIKTYEYHFKN